MKMRKTNYEGHMQVFNKCREKRCQGFEVLTAVIMVALVYWLIASCVLVNTSKYQYADLHI
jgi:succinate dehydrogenase hydrophobic anchor subunit